MLDSLKFSAPATVLVAALILGAPASAVPLSSDLVAPVTHDELVAAMAPEVGYDAATTTNSGRFQAAVYLRLAYAARERGVQILTIDAGDWVEAFLEYSGLVEDELPQFLLLMREHDQDAVLDLRPGGVIERVKVGRAPDLALNVRMQFGEGAGGAKNFSYEDHLSEPPVLVQNDSTITYRLMDMGDQVYMDQIQGSKIRPLSGSLGALFAVIGLAEIRSVRSAASEDGTSVSIATAGKVMVTVPAAVTTSPWGRAERGVPPDRDDLLATERRLRIPLDYDYRDMDWDTVDAAVLTLTEGPAPLDVAFIGNAAVRISDGLSTLYSDFPYVSGAFGYMDYDGEHVEAADAGVALISHAHADHWNSEDFARTGLTLVAPPAIAAGLPADRLAQWSDAIRIDGLVIHPLATPHDPDAAHVSYTVEWGERRLHFTGDTEDPTALLAESDLDAAFVTPWLLREVLGSGESIDATLVVVYHHTADEDVPRGAGIHVPTQNSSFRIR